jgi:hypothetical protein
LLTSAAPLKHCARALSFSFASLNSVHPNITLDKQVRLCTITFPSVTSAAVKSSRQIYSYTHIQTGTPTITQLFSFIPAAL